MREAADSTMKIRVAVTGGGASGMTAAIGAARAGAEVYLIEGNDRVGKKLLSTGNGKCNFTNRNVEKIAESGRRAGGLQPVGTGPDCEVLPVPIPDMPCFHSGDPSFPGQVLKRFGYRETIDFFKGLGVVPKEKNGYVYPAGGQASAVLDLLRLELERLGVKVICSTRIKNVRIKASQTKDSRTKDVRIKASDVSGISGFVLEGTGPEGKPFSLSADRVILACGGKAAPATASDGSGYALAEKLGHSVTPLSPALVQLRCQEDFYKRLSGIRTEGTVRLYVDGKPKAEDRGELQLTAYGISGIPVFQVSRFAGLALPEGRNVTAELDLMPSMSRKELETYFRTFSPERYGGLLNKKLLALLLKRYGTKPEDLAAGVKGFRTRIKAVNPFENAQVTAGGVDTRQIDPATMMSRIIPGLYFAGELADVDGMCGGYNLQWAWSSGYLAGSSAAVSQAPEL